MRTMGGGGGTGAVGRGPRLAARWTGPLRPGDVLRMGHDGTAGTASGSGRHLKVVLAVVRDRAVLVPLTRADEAEQPGACVLAPGELGAPVQPDASRVCFDSASERSAREIERATPLGPVARCATATLTRLVDAGRTSPTSAAWLRTALGGDPRTEPPRRILAG